MPPFFLFSRFCLSPVKNIKATQKCLEKKISLWLNKINLMDLKILLLFVFVLMNSLLIFLLGVFRFRQAST
ncbi:MAG: hypothetical protein DRG82_06530 [Deltaproteobacteria bacterium]|nr:MAG: hypothetical protein DRG82_06530 [Deltaproteobacteria bacterium]